MRSNGYLLAIESAIAGGSIALLKDGEVTASRNGDGAVSRAEDLLPNIVSMLDEAEISKNELSMVAVSLGPGSYTGLRIGIATVMGLKHSLGIEYVGVPLFEALANSGSDCIIGVPMGKTDICFVHSRSPEASQVTGLEEFMKIIRNGEPRRILVHPALSQYLDDVHNFKTLDPNLATYIGLTARLLPPSERLDPIYVQNPRFG